MAEQDPPTNPQNPAGTGGGESTLPVATPPTGGGSATGNQGDPNEMVTMKRSDLNNIISQRDSNHEQATNSEAFVERLAQERGIATFLDANKEKYPDITAEDLAHVASPDDLDSEAARLQRRFEDHTQAKLLELENAKPPTMTQEEKDAKLAELEKDGSPKALEEALRIQMA